MSETKPERTKTLGQWSAICAKSIREHLAPKGFAEIRTGVFKGAKKANIDFLSKESVDTAGRIAGGCVNHFRGRVREALNDRLNADLKKQGEYGEELSKLKFWKFERKRVLKRGIMSLNGSIGTIQILINELDYISIQ